MKSINIVLFFLCCSIPVLVQAQSTKATQKTKLFLGPTVGFNTGKIEVGEFSYYNNADLSNFNNLSGGMIFRAHMKNNVFLQTELTYTNTSATANSVNVFPFGDEEIYSDVEFNLAYLNYPLIVGYSFTTQSLKPYLSAGLHIGSALKKEVIDVPNTELPSWKSPATPPFIRFETVQFGVILEAGIQKNIANIGLLVANIRYTGSEATYKVSANSAFGAGASNLATRRVGFSIGYLMRLGRR